MIRTMATRLFGTLTPNAPGHIFRRSFALRRRYISPEPLSREKSDSRIYSILVSLPDGKKFATPQALVSWYHSFLSDGKKSVLYKDPRIITTYGPGIPGFSARLTRDELKALEKKDEFQGAITRRRYALHTTRSLDFLGQQNGTNHGKGNMKEHTEWEGHCESDVVPIA